MANIREADIACRGFSVAIVRETETADLEREVEDVHR